MNRSILIVICDFIITSMIYLNGGFSALESQSPNSRPADQQTVGILARELELKQEELEKTREKLLKSSSGASKQELERVTRELAMIRAKLENINRKNALNENNSGVMSKEEMRKELDEEIFQKHLAMQRYELLQLQLQNSRENQVSLQQQTLRAQQEIARLDERLVGQKAQFEQKLDEKDRELKQSNATVQKQEALISEQNRKLQDASDKLVKTSKDLAGVQKDLAVVQKDLEHARLERDKAQKAAARSEQARNEQVKVAQENARNLQRDLKTAEKARENAEKVSAARQAALDQERARQQQLSRELAKAQDELNKQREALKQAKAQLEKDRRNIDTMKRVVADTSQQLSKAKQEQAAAKQELKQVQAAAKQEIKQIQSENIRLKADSAKLKAVEKELDFYRSDLAQLNHSEALTEFALKWQQYRAVGRNREISIRSYLPVFSDGNRSYVVSALTVIGGKQENSSTPKNIFSLEYSVGKPGGRSARVAGPVWLASDDCRVALMEVTGLRDVKPLKLMTWDELRTRGSLDLYLFKSSKLANAKLENRCAWGAGNERYIYVTNSQTRNSSELKAEVGDLLLTRQGELAGVVVAVKNNRARCYVFSKRPTAQQMLRIGQGNAASKYQEFVTGMSLFMEKGEKLTDSQP